MANHEDDPTYVPRVPAPEGAADRVREDVIEEAERVAGQTWQDENGDEHPYTPDLSPEELGITEAPTQLAEERKKRGRGRKQNPNPDTHREVPSEKQEERAQQAIMELGVYEGRQVDRREVRFSGSAGVSAYHPEGVDLWHNMRGGQRVMMLVVGTVGAHGHRFTMDKEGAVIEVIASRTLKIDYIQLRELLDSTEGLPLFEDGTKNEPAE